MTFIIKASKGKKNPVVSHICSKLTESQAWGEENRSLILCNLLHQKNNLQVGVPKNEREDPKVSGK